MDNKTKEMTFDEFSKKLEGFNQHCGSCKYFNSHKSYCEKYAVSRDRKAMRCEHWRYFA